MAAGAALRYAVGGRRSAGASAAGDPQQAAAADYTGHRGLGQRSGEGCSERRPGNGRR